MGPSTDDQQGLMMVVMVMDQMFWALHRPPVALRERPSADFDMFSSFSQLCGFSLLKRQQRGHIAFLHINQVLYGD